MQHFATEKKRYTLPGAVGLLEVETTPAHDTNTIAVMCHPNPTQQGSMDNKVVTTLIRAFMQKGYATLRFNFRGVGQSEGQFANAIGECDDLRAILHWLQRVLPDYQVILAGFSFGSYIAASVANQWQPPMLQRLISIAPPVDRHVFDVFNNIACPWLVVQGDQDEVVPADKVIAWANRFPVDLEVMTGVGHFFHGRLIELRELVINWL